MLHVGDKLCIQKFLRGYNYNRRYKLCHLTSFLPRNAMHSVYYAVERRLSCLLVSRSCIGVTYRQLRLLILLIDRP